MPFELVTFIRQLKAINPEMVAVGYDNYWNCLPEPKLAETRVLINELSRFTKVYEKTLRPAWDEDIGE